MSQRLRSTPEDSRAHRIGNKATNFQEVPTKVARHQPVSVLRRRGFDSRRLHHLSCSADVPYRSSPRPSAVGSSRNWTTLLLGCLRVGEAYAATQHSGSPATESRGNHLNLRVSYEVT